MIRERIKEHDTDVNREYEWKRCWESMCLMYYDSKHNTERDNEWETGYQGVVKVRRGGVYKMFAEKKMKIENRLMQKKGKMKLERWLNSYL